MIICASTDSKRLKDFPKMLGLKLDFKLSIEFKCINWKDSNATQGNKDHNVCIGKVDLFDWIWHGWNKMQWLLRDMQQLPITVHLIEPTISILGSQSDCVIEVADAYGGDNDLL